MRQSSTLGAVGRIALILVTVSVAVTIVFAVSHSVSGGGAGTLGGVSVPPAKATIIARSNGVGVPALPTADKSRLPVLPPEAPTITPKTGIFPTHQGPFSNSDFSPNTEYIGQVGGQWRFVFAGTAWSDYPSTGSGALRIYTDLYSSAFHIFVAPDQSSWLQITSVQGSILHLTSDKSATLTFNLATDTFN